MASKELYEQRKRLGLCVRCGKENDTYTVCCSVCKEKHNTNALRHMKKKLEKGLCFRCGKKMDRKGNYCRKCCDNSNEQQKETYYYFQKNGICPRCKKNKLFADEKNCLECRCYCANKMSEKMKNPNEKQKAKESSDRCRRKREEKRKKLGLCVKCGKNKVDKGYVNCSVCREKHRLAESLRRDNIPRSERFEHGLCYVCGNELDCNSKLCKSCSKKMAKNIEKTQGKNDYWMQDNKIAFMKWG